MEQKKILVIDDDPDIVVALEATLKSESYNVISASDGEEGLQKVVEEKPDLVILDVIMPGKHGFQVYRELRTDLKYKDFSKIPILMLTVYPDERWNWNMHFTMRERVEKEVEDYIYKPFDPEKLLARVERLLRISAPSLI